MSKWLFGLLGLLFGLCLALLVDRMRFSRKSGPERAERRKWLYYWFMGRFPTREEEAEEEREYQEQELKKRRRDKGGGE